jgi:hypothetical protein
MSSAEAHSARMSLAFFNALGAPLAVLYGTFIPTLWNFTRGAGKLGANENLLNPVGVCFYQKKLLN